MSNPEDDLDELGKRIAGWITSAIGLVTSLVGFVRLVQKEAELVSIILLVVGIALLWGSLFYICFKKTIIGERFGHPRKQPAYSDRAQRWALVGICAVPILVVSGFVGVRYYQNRSTAKVVILVANFDGPDQDFAVTKIILDRLDEVTEEYGDVQVQALNETITEQGGREVARDWGKKHMANIVLWGWLIARNTAQINISFEVLKGPEKLVLKKREKREKVAVAELDSLQIQTRLSDEMSYLTLLTLGLARYEAEDYDGAIKRFTEALARPYVPEEIINPADIYFYRGIASFYKSEYDQAIADYDHVIAQETTNANAYNNRALAYYDKGDIDRAIADYDSALALNPEYANAYTNRGNAYFIKGDVDQAEANFDSAIELDPKLAIAYANRGNVYFVKGDIDRAIADFDKAIKLDSELALAYENIGLVYGHIGKYDRAISGLSRAIELDPMNARTYNNRGYTYYEAGEYNRAIKDINRAIELKSDFAIAFDSRGDVYVAKGEYNRAIKDYNHAIELDSYDPLFYENRRNAYLQKGDTVRAAADSIRAREIRLALQGRSQTQQ